MQPPVLLPRLAPTRPRSEPDRQHAVHMQSPARELTSPSRARPALLLSSLQKLCYAICGGDAQAAAQALSEAFSNGAVAEAASQAVAQAAAECCGSLAAALAQVSHGTTQRCREQMEPSRSGWWNQN